jgi:hypothetical protein
VQAVGLAVQPPLMARLRPTLHLRNLPLAVHADTALTWILMIAHAKCSVKTRESVVARASALRTLKSLTFCAKQLRSTTCSFNDAIAKSQNGQ